MDAFNPNIAGVVSGETTNLHMNLHEALAIVPPARRMRFLLAWKKAIAEKASDIAEDIRHKFLGSTRREKVMHWSGLGSAIAIGTVGGLVIGIKKNASEYIAGGPLASIALDATIEIMHSWLTHQHRRERNAPIDDSPAIMPTGGNLMAGALNLTPPQTITLPEPALPPLATPAEHLPPIIANPQSMESRQNHDNDLAEPTLSELPLPSSELTKLQRDNKPSLLKLKDKQVIEDSPHRPQVQRSISDDNILLMSHKTPTSNVSDDAQETDRVKIFVIEEEIVKKDIYDRLIPKYWTNAEYKSTTSMSQAIEMFKEAHVAKKPFTLVVIDNPILNQPGLDLDKLSKDVRIAGIKKMREIEMQYGHNRKAVILMNSGDHTFQNEGEEKVQSKAIQSGANACVAQKMTSPQHIRNELEPYLGAVQLIANTSPVKPSAKRKIASTGESSNVEPEPPDLTRRKKSL